MTLYNQANYNTEVYNSTKGELIDDSGEIVVDKWISPQYRRFFPDHFIDVLGYDRFMAMFKYYLQFSEQGKYPYWTLSHLSELSNIEQTLPDTLEKLRDQYAPNFRFEDFPNIDARKFLTNAKRFYARKGTDKSFEYLFNLLGRQIEIFKPIDDTLFVGENSVIGKEKIIDSFYYTPFTYDIITDLPYSQWNDFIRRMNHPAGTQMFGTYLVTAAEQIKFPSIHLNLPNDENELVNATIDVPASGSFNVEVLGNITNYPDPEDPEAEDTLILRIGDEDVEYTQKVDQTFDITARGLNGTREQSATDTSVFTIDLENNQLVYTDKLSHYTGKSVRLSTDGTLPTPLLSGQNYYTSLVEYKTTLVGDVLDTDTNIIVLDATGFPPTGKLYLNGEILVYTDLTNNNFTVIRGQDGTISADHFDENTIYLYTTVVRLSNTVTEAYNRAYIPITDVGTGIHTLNGPGVEISMFTGIQHIRPQAMVVRELIGYTTYDDINRDLLLPDSPLSDYQTWAYDFGDLTFDRAINGGTDYAIEFKMRFPLVRKEIARDVTARYYIPTLSDDVSSEPAWTADTVTPLASWSFGTPGHVKTNSAGVGEGIVRGYIDNYTPVIETDEDMMLPTEAGTEVIATVGSDQITGDFSGISFTPSNERFCVEIAGSFYRVTDLISPTVLELEKNVDIEGLNDGDSYIQTVTYYGNLAASTGPVDRRCIVSETTGLNVGPIVEIFKGQLTQQVASSVNWAPTTDTVFDATSAGHVSQLVTGATGFVRAKNTVSNTLSADITDTVTEIPLNDTSQFLDSGRVRIGTELLTYTGKTASELTGAVRGTHGTSAILHSISTEVVSANVNETPNEVYIEVDSGTFSTNVTDTLSVGNNTVAGNDVRIITTKIDVSKNNPDVGDRFYIEGDDSGSNQYEIYSVYNVINIQGDVIAGFMEDYTIPPTDLGTVNWISFGK